MEELKDSDFEIADGEPDVIDWDVVNAKGEKLGDVDDMLFDPESRKVRYLIIDMEINEVMLITNPYQVLIPIGIATLHESNDEVILPNITIEQLNELPKYVKGSVTPEYEMQVRNVLEEGVVLDSPEDWKEFYKHDHFTEGRFFRNHSDEERQARVERIIDRINDKLG